tara:strand:- start:9373 stop:10980 length:1608 start_codon:yes stop_codon:yes gene_type:complete
MSAPAFLIAKDSTSLTRPEFMRRASAILNSLDFGDVRPSLLLLCGNYSDFLAAIVIGRAAGLPIILPNASNAIEINKIIAAAENDIVVLASTGDDIAGIQGAHAIQVISDVIATPDAEPLEWQRGEASTIELFTSGTTGNPVGHTHSYAKFDHGAEVWGGRLGAQADTAVIVSTVPPQHMYGLEASVFLPLHRPNMAVFDGRPFYAADIAAAIATAGPDAILMTTPLHLELLVRENITLPPLRVIVSATSSLPQSLARQSEEMFNAVVVEVYGTTETGMIATREPARSQVFLPRTDIAVSFNNQRMTVRPMRDASTHVDDVVIDDLIVPDGAGFRYLGRGDDLINVAGKRASLAGLTEILRGIDGVDDGAFIMPDAPPGKEQHAQRPVAFVVAPDLRVDDILAALRARIPAAFLPRQVIKRAKLDKTATGKTRVGALMEIIAAGQVTFSVPDSHPALAGHFPGNPVVPGVVVLDYALRALGLETANQFRSVKFKGILRPMQTCVVEKTQTTHGVEIRCHIDGREIMRAEMTTTLS